MPILILLWCLVLPYVAQAADALPTQGVYTGDNPLAPYTGDEPFRFGASLNTDAEEFCLSVTKKGDKTVQKCYTVTKEQDRRYTLNAGEEKAELQLTDATHILYINSTMSKSGKVILSTYLTWEGKLPLDQAINTEASWDKLVGVWYVDRIKTPPALYEKFAMQDITLSVDTAGTTTIRRGAASDGKIWQLSLNKAKTLPGRFVLDGDKGLHEMRIHRDNSISLGNVRDNNARGGVVNYTRDLPGEQKPASEAVAASAGLEHDAPAGQGWEEYKTMVTTFLDNTRFIPNFRYETRGRTWLIYSMWLVLAAMVIMVVVYLVRRTTSVKNDSVVDEKFVFVKNDAFRINEGIVVSVNSYQDVGATEAKEFSLKQDNDEIIHMNLNDYMVPVRINDEIIMVTIEDNNKIPCAVYVKNDSSFYQLYTSRSMPVKDSTIDEALDYLTDYIQSTYGNIGKYTFRLPLE